MILKSPGPAAVAFDLDDSLYDREQAFCRLLKTWLGELAPEDSREILRRDGRGHASRLEFFTWMSGQWPELGPGEELWGKFREELPAHILVDPEALPLLNQIHRAGWPCGILTNGTVPLQAAKLQATGLLECFPPKQVLISGAIGADKPSPLAFAALTTVLALPPERILFVGDHAEKDIRGAKMAGMRTCWLRRRDPGGICLEADLVIDSLAELGPLLFPAA